MKNESVKKALRYWTAERFKSLQRKLSAARNTIQKDALSRELEPFYTPDEIETLAKAATILGSIKRKVEHAKEVTAREERERQRHLDHCKALRWSLLDRFVPAPETVENKRDAVVFNLALELHCKEISSGYYREHKFFASSLARVFDKTRGLSPDAFVLHCCRENREWLEKNLWHYDVEPDKKSIEQVLDDYRRHWLDEVLKNDLFAAEIAQFDQAIAI
jgi:hypothetical protein